MKTPEEIKKGLRICRSLGMILGGCGDCPYKGWDGDCECGLEDDALAYIQQLEERIDLMKLQMRGDCGTCRFRLSINGRCHDCMEGGDDPYHPLWEYEGLPGEDTYHEKPV